MCCEQKFRINQRYQHRHLNQAFFAVNTRKLRNLTELVITSYSIHYTKLYDCNAAGSTATGSEAFYFHPFSQPFAKYLAQNVSSSLGITNRGDIYNEFWVTLQQEFPSSLVELAFVTNYGEAMKLADATYQNAVADAIVNAMAQYFTNN